jgi:hypothetical protein
MQVPQLEAPQHHSHIQMFGHEIFLLNKENKGIYYLVNGIEKIVF